MAWNAQTVVVTGAGVVGILLLVGRLVWRAMTAGMYTPGELKQAMLAEKRGESLDPEDQTCDLSTPGFVNITKSIKLFVHSIGDPQNRTIVFLHGGPSAPAVSTWKIAEHFAAQNYFCVFYDMRGCGRSTRLQAPFCKPDENPFASGAMPKLESEWGMGAHILDLERLRRLLKRDKLILYGHSFGGLISLLYAIEFPLNVSAIILESPAPLVKMPPATGKQGDLFELVKTKLSGEKRQQFDAFCKKLFDFSWHLKATEEELSRFHMSFAQFYFHGEDGQVEEVVESKQWEADTHAPRNEKGEVLPVQGGYATTAAYLSLGAHHDWTSQLRCVRTPTLVLHGTEDLSPLCNSQEVASYLPQASLRTVEGASHFGHTQHAQPMAAEALAFLSLHALLGGSAAS